MAREAYITGVGQSEVGVRLPRHPLLLTLDAIKVALADAGLTLDQIDGVFSFPGKSHGYLAFSPVGTDDIIEACGIKSKWQMGAMEQPAQLSAIGMAAMAVKEGLCRHAICFRTVYEAGGMANPAEYMGQQPREVSGTSQWTAPFFATSAACWTAQYAQRHVFKYGMTREQLAMIAINGSKNAMLNPNARAITKEELTLDKYMSARMISTPQRATRLTKSLPIRCGLPRCRARLIAIAGTRPNGRLPTMPGQICGRILITPSKMSIPPSSTTALLFCL
jgi:acetyl-CoA acetyltransferase